MKNELYFSRKGDFEKLKTSLINENSMSCNNCMLTIYAWRKSYDVELINYYNNYVFYSKVSDAYSYPIGKNKKLIVDKLLTKNNELKFIEITENQKNELEELYPNKFKFIEQESEYDYIYDIDKLCTLSGKKLAPKRNLINQFISLYEWTSEEICKENFEECKNYLLKCYDGSKKLINNYENYLMMYNALLGMCNTVPFCTLYC